MARYTLTAGPGTFSLTGQDIRTPIVRKMSVKTGGFLVLGNPILFLAGQGGGTLYRWTGTEWAKVL